MSDLKSIRYHEGEGLEPWEEIPPEGLLSGTPVQSGHVYFTDDTGQLTSGIWHCTPMVSKPGPYDVNEFMMVLQGSITIEHDNGATDTIRAGESFVLAKGTPLSWKQTGDVLKFWVIFEDASGEELADKDKVLRRIDPSVALDPVGEQDTSRYVGEVPEQGIKILFQDATGQMITGVWQTSEMHTRPAPFPRNELMHILEGEVTITDGSGHAETYRAGDTFMVPKGMIYQWDSKGTVRKIFCIFQARERARLQGAA